jgi:hypothetical protein
MHFSISAVLSAALLSASASGHGLITSPPQRDTGAADVAACGQQIVKIINQDNTSHVEGLPEAGAIDSGYHADECNLWLCKGQQFADNVKNVQSYTPGQIVHMSVWLRIPHQGTANVSVVDTRTNTMIGDMLIYWGNYANETLKPMPANNSEFDITIPELGGKCTEPGECVCYTGLIIAQKGMLIYPSRSSNGGGTA